MAIDVIIPLDFSSAQEALDFLDVFPSAARPFVKVGYELFFSAGPDIVRQLKSRGHKVFLDLKLHDIPNTVRKAMTALAALGADIVNCHVSGTSPMLQAAREGLAAGNGTPPLLIGVTQLTSIDETRMRDEIGIPGALTHTVERYARLAQTNGLAGVVCSPLEAPRIKALCGADFLTVTPGVRFADARPDDQSRVATPALARTLGSDYIVVGRPITAANDPYAAYCRCVREFMA
jgi:orotidine-5'-phosphate decarboxylase